MVMMEQALRRPTFQTWPATWAIVIAGLLAYVILLELALGVTRGRPETGAVVASAGSDRQVIQVRPGSTAWDAGIRAGDTVVAEESADSPAAGAWRLITRDPATGAERELRLVAADLNRFTVSFLFLSLAFMIVGATTLLLSDGIAAARALYGLCAAGAVTMIAAPATFWGSDWALTVVWWGMAASGAATLSFFLVFPQPPNRLRHRLMPLLAGFAAVAGLLCLVYPLSIRLAPDSYPWLLRAMMAYLAICFLGGAVLVVSTWRRARSILARSQFGTIGLGTCVAFLPSIVFVFLPQAFFGFYVIRPENAIVTVAALPISFGYAVLRYHLLGVERLLRRSLIRVGIWTAILAGAAWLVTLIRPYLTRDVDPSLVSVGILIFVAVTAIPWIVTRIQALLDRLLFEDVYDYSLALLELNGQLARTRGLDQLRENVLRRLADLLNARSIAILATGERAGDGRGEAMPVRPVVIEPGEPIGQLTAPSENSIGLHSGGTLVGHLILGEKRNGEPYLQDDLRLVKTLAGGLGVTLQNIGLVEELRAHVKRLEEATVALRDSRSTIRRLYDRLTEAQEEERRRLASDLHDEPLQLVLLLLRRHEGRPESQWEPDDVADLRRVVDSLRTICMRLRPPVLDDLGLADALEALVVEAGRGASSQLSFTADPASYDASRRLPPATATALYRVTQEALNNSLKHSQAGWIDVRVRTRSGQFRIEVRDDGVGFDSARPSGGPGNPRSLGLIGMSERLRSVGGRLTIDSAPGEGASVRVDVDLN